MPVPILLVPLESDEFVSGDAWSDVAELRVPTSVWDAVDAERIGLLVKRCPFANRSLPGITWMPTPPGEAKMPELGDVWKNCGSARNSAFALGNVAWKLLRVAFGHNVDVITGTEVSILMTRSPFPLQVLFTVSSPLRRPLPSLPRAVLLLELLGPPKESLRPFCGIAGIVGMGGKSAYELLLGCGAAKLPPCMLVTLPLPPMTLPEYETILGPKFALGNLGPAPLFT